MTYGFVYVLANQSMPGIYKIGFTLKHPKERMMELSAATACPTPFTLLAFFGTSHPYEIEQSLHNDLAEYRVNASREFFKAPLAIIQDLIRQNADSCTDACYTVALDCEVDHFDFMERRGWPVRYFFQQCADPIYWPESHGGLD